VGTTEKENSTKGRRLSTRVWSALGFLSLVLLAGCAATKEAQLRKLQARSVYEAGLSHLREGRTALGLSALQEAVALDGEEPTYQNSLGLVYLDLKRLTEALESFRKAIALDPAYAAAHHNLGVALAESGRWEEAVREYRKALALPGYAITVLAYHNLGWAYYNLEKLWEAEEAFSAALRLEPAMASAHYHLGLVRLKAGRREEARAAFLRARELAPESEFGQAAGLHLRALGAEP
jgi:Tfp pilus assembly protein PilF